MSDDYLWDGSGEPDPEVARLEALLAPLGHAAQKKRAPKPSRRGSIVRLFVGLAAAIAIAVVVIVVMRRPTGPALAVTFEGANGASKREVRAGESVRTGPGARATISLGARGRVELEPESELGVVAVRSDLHRLDLARGALRAKVDAPPRFFVVGTPAAVATDLGCAYTMRVDADGKGVLQVASGWVELDGEQRHAMVPAGASCSTRRGRGPGTPTFDDASPALKSAVERLDFEPSPDTTPALALAASTVVAEARARDALTLWHLARRSEGAERLFYIARIAALGGAPASVWGPDAATDEALDRLWETLAKDW